MLLLFSRYRGGDLDAHRCCLRGHRFHLPRVPPLHGRNRTRPVLCLQSFQVDDGPLRLYRNVVWLLIIHKYRLILIKYISPILINKVKVEQLVWPSKLTNWKLICSFCLICDLTTIHSDYLSVLGLITHSIMWKKLNASTEIHVHVSIKVNIR